MGELDLALIGQQLKLSGKCQVSAGMIRIMTKYILTLHQVIDPVKFCPSFKYKPGILEADDLEDMMNAGGFIHVMFVSK